MFYRKEENCQDPNKGGAQTVKNSLAMWGISKFNSWVRKIPWRMEWKPTPVFLPGEFHGQRSLAGYSPWSQKESVVTDRLTLVLSSASLVLTFPWRVPQSHISGKEKQRWLQPLWRMREHTHKSQLRRGLDWGRPAPKDRETQCKKTT